MFNVVFFEPEIPPNTGNAIRLCSNTGCTLHLVEPLSFTLDDKRLRRAGLDYREYSELVLHRDWNSFLTARPAGRLFAVSTKGTADYADIAYQPGDTLVFGPETRGLPDTILRSADIDAVLRIPMLPHSRSLNLSNAAAVLVFEAWRQQGFRQA